MTKYILSILVIIAYITIPLFAENISYSIKGKVVEGNNSPIEFVSIQIEELGIYKETNTSGDFSFEDIPAGHYHLTFARTGYQNKTLEVKLLSDFDFHNIILEQSYIETATIDVTSSFESQDISRTPFSIATLQDRTLTRDKGENLGLTISKIPGVNVISTGIGIGKPVVRGLSSNSVIILHDGVKNESQQWGDEHSPEISLYDIDKIEILRGPASLVYGAEGIGGVINIVSKPLLYSDFDKPIKYGEVDFGGFSVNNQATGNLTFGMGFKNIGFKGHFGYRESGDVKTPDGTLLVNTLKPGIQDTITGGKLWNSGNKEILGGFSFGYNGSFGTIQAEFESFNREIQMHDPDPTQTSSQKINSNQIVLTGNVNLSKVFHIEPSFSYQSQLRKEFASITDKDAGYAQSYWRLDAIQTDIRLHNHVGNNFSGTFGTSFEYYQNQSIGVDKLIPNFSSYSAGIFASENYSSDLWTFSAGARFDSKKMSIKQTIIETDNIISAKDLNFNAFSVSLGMVFKPTESVNVYANIGRGWRPPSEYELYVNGVHEGTYRVERGLITQNPDAGINPEASLNFDLGTRINIKKLSVDISVYHNIIENFFYSAPTGLMDTISNLPIFNIRQDRASFSGIEYSFQYQPFGFLVLSLNGDYIYTYNTGNNASLPFSPAGKNILEIKVQKPNIGILNNPYGLVSAKIVYTQNNVDPLETTDPGYTLFNLGLGFDIIFSKSIASVDFSIENLFDTKYVDHLSRFKSFAMNPGRSINLKVSVPFQF